MSNRERKREKDDIGDANIVLRRPEEIF